VYDPAAGAKLEIVALELTSGRTLWRCEIGDSFQAESRIIRRHEPRAFTSGMILVADHVLLTDAAIAMDDRNVYASFVGGTVVAVDRFGGALQWMSSYNAKYKVKGDKERERRDRVKAPNRRWRDLPVSNGQIVVVAPTDGEAAFALETASGKPKWEQPAVRDLELVGIVGDRVLFGGVRVAALKADTGEVLWQTPVEPKPSGPAFVDGETVAILTAKGEVMTYAIETGAAEPSHRGDTPTLDSVFKTIASRQAMEPTGLLEAMKVALAAPADEKPVKPPPKKPEKPEKPTPKPPEKKPVTPEKKPGVR
jgi:outer membrane protein assembly factor BamB